MIGPVCDLTLERIPMGRRRASDVAIWTWKTYWYMRLSGGMGFLYDTSSRFVAWLRDHIYKYRETATHNITWNTPRLQVDPLWIPDNHDADRMRFYGGWASEEQRGHNLAVEERWRRHQDGEA